MSWLGIGRRSIEKHVSAGILVKDKDTGQYPIKENIKRWIEYKTPAQLDVDGMSEDKIDFLIKKEDLKTKQRNNNEADGIMVRKSELLPFLRNYSKQVNRDFDSIESQLDGTLIECPKCDEQMRLDGRGRQRIKETTIRLKNHLDDLHNNLESAKSE